MKAELFIWLGHSEAQPIRWIHCQRKQAADTHTGTLPDASALPQLQERAKGAAVWLLVPGEHCVHLTVTLPNQSKQARRSIPYLIEEKLCQPLEEVHVAYQYSGQGNDFDVVTVSATRMQTWLNTMADAGIQPNYVTPDFMMLPASCEGLHLLQDGERTLVRSNDTAATLSSDTLSAWIKLAGADCATLHCYGEVPITGHDTIQQRMDDPLTHLAALSASIKPLNLLQGEYARSNPLQGYLRLAKLPAAAAVLLALLHMTHTYIEIQALEKQKQAYQQAIEQVFRDALPETRRIVNPRSQMKARLAALKEQADSSAFLALLEKLSAATAAHSDVEIQSLRFDATHNSLQLQVTARDYTSLETLNEALQAQALSVDPGAYQQTSTQQISAQLTIREGNDA